MVSISTGMHDNPRDSNHPMQRALGQSDMLLLCRFLVLPTMGPQAVPIAKEHQTSQPKTGL